MGSVASRAERQATDRLLLGDHALGNWRQWAVGSSPQLDEVCAPENIQDSGEMKFHLTLYYDFVPILLETFTFWMQNDDNIIGHLYCKITLVLVSEDEYLLDIYTIYYLLSSVHSNEGSR